MANIRTLTRSFAGGEVTPEFWGRIDDVKFQTGLAKCRNFITLPHGPVQNRPGTKFVRSAKFSQYKSRLIPFNFSSQQSFAIEMGVGYFRFHTIGATLLYSTPSQWSSSTNYFIGDLVFSSGVSYYCKQVNTNKNPSSNADFWYVLPSTGEYEIPNPYSEAELFDIHYVQSSDVVTLVHPNHTPKELKRYGGSKWVLEEVSFVPTVQAPGTPSASVTGGQTNPIDTYSYKVTAIGSDNQESLPSNAATTTTVNLNNADAKVTVGWGVVSGAVAYNVYKASNTGSFGFIGQTTSTSFVDNNIAEDLGTQPPKNENPFVGSGNYPAAVSYFEQRRVFGGTTNKPQNIFMTRSGTESDLSYSIPSKDDDAIRFKVAAREANIIRHAVPLNNLMLLTSAAEWQVTSINSDALTPSSVSVRPQSYIGSNNTQPVIVNNNLIFAAGRGGHVRELAYNWQASGYITGDLSLRAPHLFDTYEIVDMSFSKSPYPVVWFISSSKKLLGLTYVPEQQIGAWHQHDTDGDFESVCSIPDSSEDSIYLVVKRTINGQEKRYIERMVPRKFADVEDAFFVDSGLTYDGEPNDVISGLDHLEGKTVNILADGAVHPEQVVTGGSITLFQEYSKVHIGLPIESDIQTLPLAFETMALGQGREKNVNTVWIRVYRSSGIFAGPSAEFLTEAKLRKSEPYGSPPSLKTEEVKIPISPSWTDSGQVYIRQRDPLPLTIVSMTLEVAIGS